MTTKHNVKKSLQLSIIILTNTIIMLINSIIVSTNEIIERTHLIELLKKLFIFTFFLNLN